MREHLREIEENAPSLMEQSEISRPEFDSDDTGDTGLSSIGSLGRDHPPFSDPALRQSADYRSSTIGATSSILLRLPVLSPSSTPSCTPPRSVAQSLDSSSLFVQVNRVSNNHVPSRREKEVRFDMTVRNSSDGNLQRTGLRYRDAVIDDDDQEISLFDLAK